HVRPPDGRVPPERGRLLAPRRRTPRERPDRHEPRAGAPRRSRDPGDGRDLVRRWRATAGRAPRHRPDEGGLTRYDWEASTRRIASTERSTSASVVVQLETEIRISRRPCQVVPPIQQVPSRWMPSITRSVRSSPPNPTRTWLSTTSFAIVTPSMAPSSYAKRRASAQQRSTWLGSPYRQSYGSAG